MARQKVDMVKEENLSQKGVGTMEEMRRSKKRAGIVEAGIAKKSTRGCRPKRTGT